MEKVLLYNNIINNLNYNQNILNAYELSQREKRLGRFESNIGKNPDRQIYEVDGNLVNIK